MTRRDSGSAALEALAATGTLSLIISVGLTLAYFVFAKFWLTRTAYEASICLATPSQAAFCEQRLREASSRVLPIGDLLNVRLSRTPVRTDVAFDWQSGGVQLRFHDSRGLPLTGVGKWI